MMTMSNSVAAAVFRRTTPQLVGLLLIAGIASVWVLSQARSMGNMPGAMGLGLLAFVVMWTIMMTAMMLPSVAPLVSLYSRTVQSKRSLRMGLFAVGYLLVWGVSGIPAYGLAWLGGELAGREAIGTVTASVVLSVAGVYQLTSWKYRCLSHCRTPIAHIFRYASFQGPLRDLRAGIHNGYYCFGCCWSLMALMVVFGLMNVYGMMVLAAVVAIEKLTPAGDRFSKAVGVGILALAVLVFWVPGIAPGLTSSSMAMN